MKFEKALLTLLLPFGLWLAVTLGCSAFRKAAKLPSPSGETPIASKDYFPLRTGDSWAYRSTTADGKQSEFSIKVLGEEQEKGNTLYLVETVSAFQPIHDWYSKPSGWVLMHRQEYVKAGSKAEYQPTRQFLKNPLVSGDAWHWKGKGMMGVDIEESNDVSGPETITVPAGKFEAMKVMTKVVQGGTPVTKTYWYAAGVGLVKSMTESGPVRSTTELMQYTH